MVQLVNADIKIGINVFSKYIVESKLVILGRLLFPRRSYNIYIVTQFSHAHFRVFKNYTETRVYRRINT